MANPTSRGGHAQDSCALGTSENTDGDTLAAKLRAMYAEQACMPFEQRAALSRAQLGELFCPHAKHGTTQVRRAHRLLRYTYRDRFREVPLDAQLGRAIGRDKNVPFVRWIEPAGVERETGPKLEAYPGSSLSSEAVPLRKPIDQQAPADRARARTRAPRVREPSPARARRPARRLELPRTPLLEQPVRIEAGALAELEARHGKRGVWQVLRVLREQACHAHPAECELAVRTLAQRAAEVPGAVFRTLFRAACRGELLVDAPADRERVRLAELEGLVRQPLEDLEARLAAVRVGGDVAQAEQLEAAIAELERRGERPRSFDRPRNGHCGADVRPPLTAPSERERARDPTAAARFLGMLTPKTRAALDENTS